MIASRVSRGTVDHNESYLRVSYLWHVRLAPSDDTPLKFELDMEKANRTKYLVMQLETVIYSTFVSSKLLYYKLNLCNRK